MKGDFTRLTFRRDKHYRGVLLQQGRVQLDADWNEQVDIDGPPRPTTTATSSATCVGPAGAPASRSPAQPAHLAGARRRRRPARSPPGRYYVDGILCENEAAVSAGRPAGPAAAAQSSAARRHGPATPARLGPTSPTSTSGSEHVTALEDPALREVALGGPDTATRSRTVWQVGLSRSAEPAPTCLTRARRLDAAARRPERPLARPRRARPTTSRPLHRRRRPAATAGWRTSSTASRSTTAATTAARAPPSSGRATTARWSRGSRARKTGHTLTVASHRPRHGARLRRPSSGSS